MAIDYVAFKSELNSDPQGFGYAAPRTAGNDVALAALVNQIRATILIRRSDIPGADIYNAITVADYTALPGSPTAAQLSTERRLLAWITGLAPMVSVRLLNDDGTDAPTIVNLKAMFAGGTGTLTRLTALASRQGSRAEQLFGTGTVVTAFDVAKALRQT